MCVCVYVYIYIYIYIYIYVFKGLTHVRLQFFFSAEAGSRSGV